MIISSSVLVSFFRFSSNDDDGVCIYYISSNFFLKSKIKEIEKGSPIKYIQVIALTTFDMHPSIHNSIYIVIGNSIIIIVRIKNNKRCCSFFVLLLLSSGWMERNNNQITCRPFHYVEVTCPFIMLKLPAQYDKVSNLIVNYKIEKNQSIK